MSKLTVSLSLPIRERSLKTCSQSSKIKLELSSFCVSHDFWMTGVSNTDINSQQRQWWMQAKIAHLPACLTPQCWFSALAPSQRLWSSSSPFPSLFQWCHPNWGSLALQLPHMGGIKPAWCYTTSAVLQRSLPREFSPTLREFNGLIIGKEKLCFHSYMGMLWATTSHGIHMSFCWRITKCSCIRLLKLSTAVKSIWSLFSWLLSLSKFGFIRRLHIVTRWRSTFRENLGEIAQTKDLLALSWYKKKKSDNFF